MEQLTAKHVCTSTHVAELFFSAVIVIVPCADVHKQSINFY